MAAVLEAMVSRGYKHLNAKKHEENPDEDKKEGEEGGHHHGNLHFEYDSDTIEEYKMISAEFDYHHLLKDDSFSVKQYKDSIYRGQIDITGTMKRHGKGVLVYNSGRVYEGTWHQDKRHGNGYEIFADSN